MKQGRRYEGGGWGVNTVKRITLKKGAGA